MFKSWRLHERKSPVLCVGTALLMFSAMILGFVAAASLSGGTRGKTTLEFVIAAEDKQMKISTSDETIATWILEGLRRISRRIFLFGDEILRWPDLKLNQPRTILGIILGGLGAALASAGGLGGGGLFVPLFNLLLQFDAKTSAALSNFMILGGSVVNLVINLRERHPLHNDKPVIDFDAILLMQPSMLLGISIGVILNVMLPTWFIIAALAIVLGYMTMFSFQGAIKRWNVETQQNNQRKALDGAPILITTHHRNEENDLCQPLLDADVGLAPLSKLIPGMKVAALLMVWLAFFSIQIFRGGKGGLSVVGLEKCGIAYWAITFAQLPLAVVLSALTIHHLSKSCAKLGEHNGKALAVQEETYVLSRGTATLFPWLSLLAGILGGMLGIGGGMIINPLLFGLGMLPQVTAATCAVMVFFSSSMSVIQYWLLGRIPVKYAVTSAVLCAVFSWIGIVGLNRVIRRYNRASLIVFSVATVMGLSAVLMCGFGGWHVWVKYARGDYMGLNFPC